MQPQDDILPLYTGVVRLKSYGKGEDVHVCRNRRSHLLVLTPDAIQLFTTSDAGMEEDLVGIDVADARQRRLVQ